MKSALYHGVVTHERFRPVRHALRYRIFMLLLDFDDIGKLPRLLGVDRPGLLSFQQKDHGDGSRTGLRAWLSAQLAQAGLTDCGHIQVLCMPRVLGHVFNPLTVYFCHDASGALRAVVYEVNNTFGGRHAYVLPVQAAGGAVVQDCAKIFHVSPFMDMDLHYRFHVRIPGQTVSIVIHANDAQGAMLTAAFAGRQSPLTQGAIVGACLKTPLLGLKVLGGIHWEALKLWLKGLKLRPTPRKPEAASALP